MKQERKNHLTQGHYTLPGVFSQTMTLKEWRETALYTEGWITASGSIWDLVATRIAPGVYRVTTERRR